MDRVRNVCIVSWEKTESGEGGWTTYVCEETAAELEAKARGVD